MAQLDFSEEQFIDFNRIRDMLEKRAGGVATLNMWQLRDAYGAVKLGSLIVEEISQELDRRGIGHIPVELIPDQWEKARVYLRAGPCGKLLDAAVNPGNDTDESLREFASDQNSLIVDQIRRLLR